MESLAPCLQTPEFAEAWAAWLQHRKEIRHPLKETSQKRLLKKFATWGPERSIAAINYSIEMGYQGLFEEKGAPYGSQNAGGGLGSVARVRAEPGKYDGIGVVARNDEVDPQPPTNTQDPDLYLPFGEVDPGGPADEDPPGDQR